MKADLPVATPPPKPLMIFDGDCEFCRLWIRRWQQATGDRVEYVPFQASHVVERFPGLAREQLATAVHLIEPDGTVFSGAEAAFRALAHNPAKERPLRWYQRSPTFANITERAYRFVAEHRPLFSRLTRWGWGKHVEQPECFLARWWFLRALGVIYLIAFLSLWIQISGLIGSNGILPAGQFMSAAARHFDTTGISADRYRQLPTLCWLNASDGFLNFQCAAGAVLAGLLIAGIAPAPCLFLLWVIYLSLATVGREFLGFQWDNLLLETGFLAIFLAPFRLGLRSASDTPPSAVVLWLFRWLLFRLMFESGVVKLASGDATWHNFTALSVHYETQPLPTWIGWYAHQMPSWFQKASCLVMFFIEMVVPFLMFTPRRPRIFGAMAVVFLQVIILLTGNYTYFNWLTLALCLLLLDDFALEKVTPTMLRGLLTPDARPPNSAACLRRRRVIPIGLAMIIVPISAVHVVSCLHLRPSWLMPVVGVNYWLAPLRTVNSYGLFAVMTTERPEIIIEGSHDGITWLPYEFKYKPGDVKRRPGFVAPHQPRLDWQMWFAALGSYRQNPWLMNFCVRLLQNSPEVLALLKTNPFPEAPPHFVRAMLYDYRFTSSAERKHAADWWKRELRGEYFPPLSLRNDNRGDSGKSARIRTRPSD